MAKKRYRLKVKNIILAAVVLALFIALIVFLFSLIFGGNGEETSDPGSGQPGSSENGESADPENPEDEEPLKVTATDANDSWQLILVNPDHFVPEDYQVDMTMISGNYEDIPALDNMQVDTRIVDSLLEMFQAAKADGENLFLRAAYRTLETQQIYYDWHISYYMGLGHSEEEAKTLTLRYIAYPGASEHHTGLAVDIISVDWQNSGKEIIDEFDETTEAAWLRDHAHEYGFIMRYPKEKESITKIGYEPWHFRYVGKAHAKAVKESGLSFEEYMTVYEQEHAAE